MRVKAWMPASAGMTGYAFDPFPVTPAQAGVHG